MRKAKGQAHVSRVNSPGFGQSPASGDWPFKPVPVNEISEKMLDDERAGLIVIERGEEQIDLD